MNILLTSAGRRTYLVNYFKQALKGEGLIYASNSVMTYTLTQADGFVITPNIYNDNYIGFLIHFCKAHDISVIIPLFDIDLAVLAKNKEVFKKEGIFVVVADYKSIQICNDKWLTYQFLSDLGLPQPYTALRIDEAKSMLSAGRLSFPLILTPRWGMGSIGIYKVYNEAELLSLIHI